MNTGEHPEEWLRVYRKPEAGVPALFLDRDGTLIENVPYLSDPDQVALIHGVVETLRLFRANGFATLIVSNQSGIARELCTVSQYRAVEDRVQSLLSDAAVDVVYACPFHPDAKNAFGVAHPSRKPGHGMFLDAARRFAIDLASSVMVGDSLVDIQAASTAGVGRVIHVQTGHGHSDSAAVRAYAAQAQRAVEFTSSLADVRPMAGVRLC